MPSEQALQRLRERRERRSRATERVRAALLPPPGFAPLTSVWATKSEVGDATRIALDVEVADVAPGWRVEAAGQLYTVQAVDGVRLDCVPVEGGEA